MSKGNKRQKDDKANMKPKQDKPKQQTELTGFSALSHVFDDKK